METDELLAALAALIEADAGDNLQGFELAPDIRERLAALCGPDA